MKYLILILFFSATLKAEIFDYPSIILSAESHLKKDHHHSNEKLIDEILNDYKNLVSEEFTIPAYLKPRVRFWFDIYSKYTLKSAVIHDKKRPELVYATIDLNPLTHLNNPFIEESIIKSSLKEKLDEVKSNLNKLKYGKKDPEVLKLEQTMLAAGLKLPVSSYQRSNLINELLKDIRIQTGQKDQIEKSILNYLPFQFFLQKLTEVFGLPKEVIYISFLESSFNPKVVSKVGAAGIWQIMPYIGAKFYPKHDKIDYRFNPILASYPAFYILKENKAKLKSWDLAISAYNSGYKHILAARKRLKMKDLNLEDLVVKYKDKGFGFASLNYYSEFLALVYALSYKDVLFKSQNFVSKVSYHDFFVYLTKCKTKIEDKTILALNPQFESDELKKDYILISHMPLSYSHFTKVEDSEFLKFPKDWKNDECPVP